MIFIEPAGFLTNGKTYPIIDVRSPGEFIQGHIPNAYNIPLFDDQERATIGTLYHQSGRESAIVKGLDISLPKVSEFIRKIRRISEKGIVLVHCWRGGMRSETMAMVFSQAGFQTILLKGGYKSYRRFIREELATPRSILVLGGFTGSGKTDLLRTLARHGQQVLDLEALANHKGSVFGGIGQAEQPTNEQFENNMYQVFAQFDLSRPIWMEDESRKIGAVTLPDPIYKKILDGNLIVISEDKEKRVNRLVYEYAGCQYALLRDAILRIRDRLGGVVAQEALDALLAKDYHKVADNLLTYYDKAYSYGITRRDPSRVFSLCFEDSPVEMKVNQLINFASNII